MLFRMRLLLYYLCLVSILQSTSGQNIKLINLDNRPWSEANYPKYAVMKANPALEFLPDNFTFCFTFFYEFGFPTLLMKVEQIKFEYDAVGNYKFVDICRFYYE